MNPVGNSFNPLGMASVAPMQVSAAAGRNENVLGVNPASAPQAASNSMLGLINQPDMMQLMSMMMMVMLQMMQLLMSLLQGGMGLFGNPAGMGQMSGSSVGDVPAGSNNGAPSGSSSSAPQQTGNSAPGSGTPAQNPVGDQPPASGSPQAPADSHGHAETPILSPGNGETPDSAKPLEAALHARGMIMPVPGAPLLSDFHADRSYGTHGGYDLPAPQGTPILAAQAGVVVESGWYGGGYAPYGNMVTLQHEDGTYSRYAHMVDTPPVEVGTEVEQGQQIGEVGSTGNSSGPHLHFEVREGLQKGQMVDIIPRG